MKLIAMDAMQLIVSGGENQIERRRSAAVEGSTAEGEAVAMEEGRTTKAKQPLGELTKGDATAVEGANRRRRNRCMTGRKHHTRGITDLDVVKRIKHQHRLLQPGIESV
jgi:hypothetical protein